MWQGWSIQSENWLVMSISNTVTRIFLEFQIPTISGCLTVMEKQSRKDITYGDRKDWLHFLRGGAWYRYCHSGPHKGRLVIPVYILNNVPYLEWFSVFTRHLLWWPWWELGKQVAVNDNRPVGNKQFTLQLWIIQVLKILNQLLFSWTAEEPQTLHAWIDRRSAGCNK